LPQPNSTSNQKSNKWWQNSSPHNNLRHKNSYHPLIAPTTSPNIERPEDFLNQP
jgi:hypothetical protein